MSDRTTIEWTRSADGTPGATWNPVTGCTEISPGCDRCYAKTLAERFRGTAGHYYERGFDLQLRPNKLKRHGRMRALLNSGEFREQIGWHATRLHPYWTADDAKWPFPNVWLGVTTENQKWANIRIPALLETPAAVRFISAEPLLSEIYLTVDLLWRPDPCPRGCGCAFPEDADRADCACGGPCCYSYDWNDRKPDLDWVIVGGESGRGARPMHPNWARSLRDQCQEHRIPFLFKQWGEFRPAQPGVDTWDQLDVFPVYRDRPMTPGADLGPMAHMRRVGKKAAGRDLDGTTWDEYPDGT